MAVMVGASFGVGMDGDCACPQFFCAHSREIDGCFSVHTGCGGYIAVQLIAGHHTHAVMFPWCMAVLMFIRMAVGMGFLIVVMMMAHINYLFLNYLLFNYRLNSQLL